MEYIDIDKDLVPYKFEISLLDETYTFNVEYNSMKDYFTVDLYKDSEIIVLGEKLIYGKPLFLTSLYKDIPKVRIIPLDLAGKAERISFENLNEEVFLFLIGDNDEILD